MKNLRIRFILTSLVIAAFSVSVQGQNAIENLIVETYYVSDANDATDTDGGTLPEGSVTYRVFLDLQPGVKITRIFGDENHPWILESTENFWNNEDRGEFFGYDIGDNRLDENTVALDSWFTLGAASDEHVGIPKNQDSDGSIVGGENNDGGSEGIEGGLLVNQTSEIGEALTQSDGLLPWPIDAEFPDFTVVELDDLEAILGDATIGNSFTSGPNSTLQFANGIGGLNDENLVLIAQFTTLGELSFRFNVALNVPGIDGEVIYVADGANLQEGEVISPFLTFPPECGCTDPDFLEFDPAAPCDDGSCETLIVFGCTDLSACNFDPDANVNVPELCCFSPDNCNGLDWTVICPTLSIDEPDLDFVFEVFPNPSRDFSWIKIQSDKNREMNLEIFTIDGRLVHRQNVNVTQGEQQIKVDLQQFTQGIHVIRLSDDSESYSKMLIKQ